MLASFNYSPSTGALWFAGVSMLVLHIFLFRLKQSEGAWLIGAIFSFGICLVTLGTGKGDGAGGVVAFVFWGPVSFVAGGVTSLLASTLGGIFLKEKPASPPATVTPSADANRPPTPPTSPPSENQR
jgi:hypothetical protein